MAQASESMRKKPTQARASVTVDAIIEAAIQILQSDGEERLTTNRIAERAGVSIGTLYQYFADKDAIIEAIADRERSRVVAAIVKSLSEVDPADFEKVLREIVRTLIGAFSRRQRARHVVVSTILQRWQNVPDKRGAGLVADFLVAAAGRERGEKARTFTPVSAFVATRAMMGAIRSAVLENAPFFESQEFEDELVHLALSLGRR